MWKTVDVQSLSSWRRMHCAIQHITSLDIRPPSVVEEVGMKVRSPMRPLAVRNVTRPQLRVGSSHKRTGGRVRVSPSLSLLVTMSTAGNSAKIWAVTTTPWNVSDLVVTHPESSSPSPIHLKVRNGRRDPSACAGSSQSSFAPAAAVSEYIFRPSPDRAIGCRHADSIAPPRPAVGCCCCCIPNGATSLLSFIAALCIVVVVPHRVPALPCSSCSAAKARAFASPSPLLLLSVVIALSSSVAVGPAARPDHDDGRKSAGALRHSLPPPVAGALSHPSMMKRTQWSVFARGEKRGECVSAIDVWTQCQSGHSS